MNIEQLIYIVEVAKTGSISAASQSVHVSQAGISQAISSLEDELGVKLFNRSRIGSNPTENGKLIISKAKEILKIMGEIKDISEVKKSKFAENMVLKISATPILFRSIIQKSLPILKADFPNVNIEFSEKDSLDIITDIKQQKIDIGLVFLYKNKWLLENELSFNPLIKTKMTLYVNKHSELASYDIVTPNQILEYPLALYNGNNTTKFIEEFSKRYGTLNILFTSNKIEMVKEAILENNAASFLVDLFERYDPDCINGDMIPVSISKYNYTPVVFNYGWLYSKKKVLSDDCQTILDHLTYQIQNWNPYAYD